MSTKHKAVSAAEGPNMNGGIYTTTDQYFSIIIEGDDAGRVPSELPDTFSCTPIPNAKGSVHTSSDEFQVIELKGADGPGVASNAEHFLILGHIPNSDGVIIGSGDQDWVLDSAQMFNILEACNTVQMSFQCAHPEATSAPVPFEIESFAVDVFPRTGSEF